ncbi:MAG: tetratricopeptide repeat protein [bacterium]
MVGLVLPAQTLSSDRNYQELTARGIELAYNLHFDQATETFQDLIELEPDNPHGYLLLTVSYYYRYQLEEHHEKFAKKFLEFSQQAIEHAKRKLGKKEEKLDALFYLGTANVYLATYHGWESNWLRAYWYGRDGIEYLERVVALEPEYYDAYLGLGLYHYYADVIPKFAKAVTFLLGIEADREKGLAELELAAEHGTYSRAEALLFLGSIHLYIEKDYQKSRVYFEKLADLYPENGTYLMLLGETYQKLGMNDQAAKTLSRLVEDTSAPQFPVLVISSHFRLGNLYYNQRDLPKAITHYQNSLRYATQSTGNVKWVFALANLNLGRSYDLLGRRETALEYYRRVKRSDHKHAYKMARERIKKPLPRLKQAARNRNFDEIIEVYQGALAKSQNGDGTFSRSKLAEMNYNIATAMFDKGAYQSALARFQRIVRMEEVEADWIKPWAHFYIGKCYLESGESEKASAAFQEAARFQDEQLQLEIDKARDLLTAEHGSN